MGERDNMSGEYQLGRYPRSYNPKVHGPYMPGRFYGKPDTPFGQVKLGELGAWLGRREKSPQAIFATGHRAYWRWAAANLHVKKPTFVPFAQIALVFSGIYFFLGYSERKYHRHCK